MCTAVTAKISSRYEVAAVRACDQRRPLEWPRAALTRAAARALPLFRSSGFHPPLFLYMTHAASSATPSMLPQPVAKSQPGPAL